MAVRIPYGSCLSMLTCMYLVTQGVVVVLEALRVLAEAKFKPANTLEFHFYSGMSATSVLYRPLLLNTVWFG